MSIICPSCGSPHLSGRWSGQYWECETCGSTFEREWDDFDHTDCPYCGSDDIGGDDEVYHCNNCHKDFCGVYHNNNGL